MYVAAVDCFFRFMDNNESPHAATIFNKFLGSEGIACMVCPAYWKNFSPIENLCDARCRAILFTSNNFQKFRNCPIGEMVITDHCGD